ncbi:MAG: hypothetical protein E7613_00635 [Ruminococcaceae bacterium]|nr:hypothetical protein [Oscillospiraceae bacterium]
MIYYFMLLGAAALFSIQFLFQQRFEKAYGTDLKSALVFSVGTGFGMGLIAFVIALFMEGMHANVFSLIVSFVHGLASFLFMYCSLKALKYANLSVFAVFSMLGGMLLPFFYGIFLAPVKEEVTAGKLICCALITLAVICTITGDKKGNKKAYFYYFAVFVTNGMTSVCASVHQNYPLINVDSYSYTALASIWLMVLGLVFLPFVKGEIRKTPMNAIIHMTGFSICSGVGNIILMLALLVLDASVQFPYSTGAAVVFSAIITFITGVKMKKNEILAVVIAFFATVAMMF